MPDKDFSGRRSGLSELTSPKRVPVRARIGARLRNYFLTGLIIVGPLTITVWIAWWFINAVDASVKPLMPDFEAWLRQVLPEGTLPGWLSVPIPGVGLVFALIGITMIGALTANLFGRAIVSYSEIVLGRMPVVRNVYSGLKQIFETVFAEGGNSFQKVGLVEFPRPGMWSIIFIAGETRGIVADKLGSEEPTVCAFLPCTPNPTTGYLIYVPRRDVIELDMSIEDAAKLVISAGLITPGDDRATRPAGAVRVANPAAPAS